MKKTFLTLLIVIFVLPFVAASATEASELPMTASMNLYLTMLQEETDYIKLGISTNAVTDINDTPTDYSSDSISLKLLRESSDELVSEPSSYYLYWKIFSSGTKQVKIKFKQTTATEPPITLKLKEVTQDTNIPDNEEIESSWTDNSVVLHSTDSEKRINVGCMKMDFAIDTTTTEGAIIRPDYSATVYIEIVDGQQP